MPTVTDKTVAQIALENPSASRRAVVAAVWYSPTPRGCRHRELRATILGLSNAPWLLMMRIRPVCRPLGVEQSVSRT